VVGAGSVADLSIPIQQSTSITSLSIRDGHIGELDDASKTAIKEKIVDLRLWVAGLTNISDSGLATTIAGSKAMKKVILSGHLHVEGHVELNLLETLRVMKAACKNKGIELWKENFEIGNGKVDLEK
jgi:hypothetical protein